MSSFEGENMQTQYNNLSYRIDLYFHDYKPTIKKWWKWTQRQKRWLWNKKAKSNKKKHGCKFLGIDSDKEDFDIFRTIKHQTVN